jgi:hypothetical protein
MFDYSVVIILSTYSFTHYLSCLIHRLQTSVAIVVVDLLPVMLAYTMTVSHLDLLLIPSLNVRVPGPYVV